MSAPQVPADLRAVLSPSPRPGGAPRRSLRELTPSRESTGLESWTVGGWCTSRWTWSRSPLNCFSPASKPAQTSRMTASARHGVGERIPPVLRNKNQVNMQVVNNMAAGSDIGIRVPAR
ncbi:hypothetical protein GCM10027162_43840 [Streptomyces incanus]